MIHYTERIATLMQDIVARVAPLSFIDMTEVLVFARPGRKHADGAFATCHCLSLPPSEPGYYFWRNRKTGELARRSEWFITKSPEVYSGSKRIKYLISFALPRFCDQSLARSRKEEHYSGFEPWVAKLDTIVHELYHIDPKETGIRRVERADGTDSARSHHVGFYEEVARMAKLYLATSPARESYEFLQHTFSDLNARFGGVVGTTFRTFPSFPQRYIEPLGLQPDTAGAKIEPVKRLSRPTRYTEADLEIRQFLDRGTRALASRPGFRVVKQCAARPVRLGATSEDSAPGTELSELNSSGPHEPRSPVARAQLLDSHFPV